MKSMKRTRMVVLGLAVAAIVSGCQSINIKNDGGTVSINESGNKHIPVNTSAGVGDKAVEQAAALLAGAGTGGAVAGLPGAVAGGGAVLLATELLADEPGPMCPLTEESPVTSADAKGK